MHFVNTSLVPDLKSIFSKLQNIRPKSLQLGFKELHPTGNSGTLVYLEDLEYCYPITFRVHFFPLLPKCLGMGLGRRDFPCRSCRRMINVPADLSTTISFSALLQYGAVCVVLGLSSACGGGFEISKWQAATTFDHRASGITISVCIPMVIAACRLW